MGKLGSYTPRMSEVTPEVQDCQWLLRIVVIAMLIVLRVIDIDDEQAYGGSIEA